MPLKKLPYNRLQHLIQINLSTKENADTEELIVDLSNVRRRGYLTKPELVQICCWKSPRAIRQILRNHTKQIENITKSAFATQSEQKKLSLLISLHGVGVPMASAILMLTNPMRYGVIDIRVWQLLYDMGAVNTKINGKEFNFKQWYTFLKILRCYSKKYKVGARDVERTIFNVHKKYQRGNLYKL